MRWSDIDVEVCSVARTLSIIGDRWTLLIIRDCFMGIRRFDEFQKNIGLSRHRLADRLTKLVEHDVLKKVRYQEKPERFEYKLTAKGIDLYPVLMSLIGWGNKWAVDEDGLPLEYVHNDCGQAFQPVLSCSECGEPVDPRQVTPKPGPGIINRIQRNGMPDPIPVAWQRMAGRGSKKDG